MGKRTFMAVIVAFVCCLSSVITAAGPEIDGFRGMKWGTLLEDAQKTKALNVLQEDQENKTVVCSIGGDKMRIGGARLVSITYLFWDGKLSGVEIRTAGNQDFDALKAAAFEKFGKGINDGSAEEERFYWKGEVSSIVLSRKGSSEQGSLKISSTKLEEPLKAFQAEQARNGAATDF